MCRRVKAPRKKGRGKGFKICGAVGTAELLEEPLATTSMPSIVVSSRVPLNCKERAKKSEKSRDVP